MLYDGTGKLEELYPTYLKYKDLELHKLEQESLNGVEHLYFVNGNGEAAFSGNLSSIENGYKIHTDDTGSQNTDWYPITSSGIEIVVIDNYNHEVVTMKNSSYVTPGAYFSDVQ